MLMKAKKKWWIAVIGILLLGMLWLFPNKNITVLAKTENARTLGEWIVDGDTIVSYVGTEAEVVIPTVYEEQEIKKIGDNAFSGNTRIQSIEMPDTIISIGDRAFEDCLNLTNVTLSSSLSEIGVYAFSNCEKLIFITLPGSLKHIGGIGAYTFYSCDNLTEVILEEGIESIGEYAFYECKNLERVQIPSTLKKIDTWTFGFCEKLKDIDIPVGMEKIGSASFYGCSSLDSIVIPSSVTEIGTHSFRGCLNLSDLTIFASLETIPYRAFSGCTALTILHLNEGLTSIGDEAFYETGLQTIELPSTLVSIGAGAFYGCTKLETFTAPRDLQTIGEQAFFYCKSLNSVQLSDKLTNIPSLAFSECSQLNRIEIPLSVQSIGAQTFKGCTSLSDVSFSRGIKTIGEEAFLNTALQQLSLPNGLLTIGKRAFSNNKQLSKITLPSSLETLSESVFENCISLKGITFANGLKTIESKAFNGCSGLATLTLPNTLVSIGEGAFSGAEKLYSVILPATLTNIGADAFKDCYRLVEVFNLTALGIECGEDTYGSVAMYAQCVHVSEEDNSCVKVDKDGFVFYINGEKRLLVSYVGEATELVLPAQYLNGKYEIEDYAFYKLENITSITISRGVKGVGYKAFDGCTMLLDVKYEGNETEWANVEIRYGNDCLKSVEFLNTEVPLPPAPPIVDPEKPTYTPNWEQKYTIWDFLGEQWSRFTSAFIKNIFAFNFFFILLWGILLLYTDKSESEKMKKRKKLLFVLIACTQWILISGLRADSVGDDTENYMRFFDQHAKLSWQTVLKGLGNYVTTGEMGSAWYLDMEPLFIVFNRLVASFTTNHVVYKFIIAIIFMSALGLYIYKYSEDPCMSFILYGALFFNMFSLTGYRQVLSVALVLFGFRFIKEQKLIPFLCVLAVAYFFHRTTLIFLVLYILANKKITPTYIIGILAVLAGMVVFRQQVFSIVKVFMGYEEYVGNYGFKQQTFALLLAALTGVSVWRYKYIMEEDSTAIQYYNGLILSWLMFPLAMESPSCMRLVYDFGFVLLLLVPLIVKSFKGKSDRLLVYAGIYAIFALQVLTSEFPYAVFWQ